MNRVGISVVIPTKNRKDDLFACIGSILKQDCLPEQLIIIDQSDTKDNIEYWLNQKIGAKLQLIYRYDTTISGAAQARNVGIDYSTCELVLFLDDDAFLLEGALAHLAKFFQEDSNNEIGAIGLFIMNNQGSLRAYLADLLFSHGPFRSIFIHTYVHRKFDSIGKELFPCRMIGGCVCYRRQIFELFKFEDSFIGASFGEDLILSFKTSSRYKVYYALSAKIEHDRLKKHRENKGLIQKRIAFLNFYLFNNFLKKTPYNIFCYALVVIKDFLKIFFNCYNCNIMRNIVYSYSIIIKIITNRLPIESGIQDILK